MMQKGPNSGDEIKPILELVVMLSWYVDTFIIDNIAVTIITDNNKVGS